MKIHELDTYLRHITKSEQYHLDHPHEKSKRYESIPKVIVENQEMYEFSFNSLLTNSNISIMKESRFTSIPLHIHKVIEVNYIYSGTCTQIINGKKIKLNTGDVCLLDCNTPHEILDIGEEDIIIIIDMRKRYFTDGFLQKLSLQGNITKFLVNSIQDNTNEKQFITFSTQNDAELRLLFQLMLCDYWNDEQNGETIDAYMTIIFSKLLKIFKNSDFSKYNVDKSILTLEILQYLEKNYKNTTLKEAAEHFNFNPTYFGNYIKKNTGKTFKELIIRKKLTTACYYLVNTDLPIYEIASEIGYENLGFFYKKFNEIYGMNPQEFRDTNQ